MPIEITDPRRSKTILMVDKIIHRIRTTPNARIAVVAKHCADDLSESLKRLGFNCHPNGNEIVGEGWTVTVLKT